MRSRHLVGCALSGALAASLVLAATTPASATKPGSGQSTGIGQVFMVNPVQSSGDQSLTDAKDANYPALAAQYADVRLRNLDGSGYLSGRWVTVRSSTGAPAYSPQSVFRYTRDQDQFEQVMGYFWVDETQEYLQDLGFGTTLPPILQRSFDLRIGQSGADNSYLTTKGDYIRLGKGGVDDGEDAEVIVHEYGHAVQEDQNPGFGTSYEARGIGESFGDYLAVSVGLAAADRYGWPVRAEEACPMDWDATSYSDAPHCIRRFDLDKTYADVYGADGQPTAGFHTTGQIWSRALWEIRGDYEALGLGTRAWDTTLIASQFGYADDTSWSAAAAQTYAAARDRDGQAAADAVRARFAQRGIRF